MGCIDGGIRDVTRRYAPRWSAVCTSRGSLTRHWDAFMALFADGTVNDDLDAATPSAVVASLELARADLHDEQRLAKRAKREPIPTSRAAFKKHATYILDSQLRGQDVVHPPTAK